MQRVSLDRVGGEGRRGVWGLQGGTGILRTVGRGGRVVWGGLVIWEGGQGSRGTVASVFRVACMLLLVVVGEVSRVSWDAPVVGRKASLLVG